MYPIQTIDLSQRYNDFCNMTCDCLSLAYHSKHLKYDYHNDLYEKVNNDSNYLMNHQPCIWNKKLFYDSLFKPMSPWQHEDLGTQYLRDKSINIYRYRLGTIWYIGVVDRGIYTTIGKQLLLQMNV